MEKLRMNVQGRVQGVGFRYMTTMVADQLGVTGSVKNEDDGSVSITAIAPEDIMETFIKKIKDNVRQGNLIDDSPDFHRCNPWSQNPHVCVGPVPSQPRQTLVAP